jgi:BirA family biotin operon repressor/biotin-[acetyl-CoA-carboxylase] ligase
MKHAWPEGVGVQHYDVLDSTNETAHRLASDGQSGPLWIVARKQSQGRGRRGRVWVSPPGNLYATLLLAPSAPKRRHAELGFAAALAVSEALAAYAPETQIALKWPNDVLLNARKVSGLLLEGLSGGALAIGIGVNLKHYPGATEFPATSLKAETGAEPEPDAVFAVLAARVHAWYEIWMEQGFDPVRNAWLARVFGLGGAIRVRLADGETQGTFEGVDRDGALLLRDASGSLARVAAGDVFF